MNEECGSRSGLIPVLCPGRWALVLRRPLHSGVSPSGPAPPASWVSSSKTPHLAPPSPRLAFAAGDGTAAASGPLLPG